MGFRALSIVVTYTVIILIPPEVDIYIYLKIDDGH